MFKIKNFSIVPKFIILLLDLGAAVTALFIAILIQQNVALRAINWEHVLNSAFLILLVNSLVFTTTKSYTGIVRYTGVQDAVRIAAAVAISSFIILVINTVALGYSTILSLTTLVISLYTVFTFLFLISYRVLVKYLFAYAKNYKMKKKSVVIFGAGDTGVATQRVLENDGQSNIQIVAFIDDDKKKGSKNLNGAPIVTFAAFKELASLQPIDELIIASYSLPTKRKNEIVDFCLDHDIKALSVPAYSKWAEGKFTSRQLQSIKIEDLLERDPININNNQIKSQIKGKRILVTGAAGSIGSEIVRQLIPYAPELIILCDQAETPLHSLELELLENGTRINCLSYLADITNRSRMESLFEEFKPQYVYHAAAYKHVPMMELCPTEAVRNNVVGVKLIADLSVKYNVERFVMISTDKAVNPTNVMGASKRMAEMYVQALSKQDDISTKFITTRFGNVLGSNGSVIIRFKEQIEKGGPVTVTHPNITRYFMTIPEACQLVLEAGSMGNGGEIFVFDMGQPVAIADLAKKMIRLYGLIPNIDVNITSEFKAVPLHWATMNNNLEMIRLLIDMGADVNIKNKVNSTSLYYAVRNQNLEIVKYLKIKNADINITKNNETILEYAQRLENKDIYDCLV
jgi:FlaA1/EpsC-like NDP-sugar epimerase